MSRAGCKPKPEPVSELDGIPMPPQVVQNVQQAMLMRRQAAIYSACRNAAWKGRYPLWRAPEVHGAKLASILLEQIERQIRERQSKIVVPKPGMMVPR